MWSLADFVYFCYIRVSRHSVSKQVSMLVVTSYDAMSYAILRSVPKSSAIAWKQLQILLTYANMLSSNWKQTWISNGMNMVIEIQ
jgi:hypothetical protein